MAKAMVFLDGTWLYSNVPKLCESLGQPGYRIDFGRLPSVLCDQLYELMEDEGVDLVRTHLFGSHATGHDPRDDESVQRRRDFFELLRSEYRYEVELFPIEFRGRRLRRVDRDAGDPFRPDEKHVAVALASSLLLNAALPGAYDIALVVAGDAELKPALRAVRRLGKRVALASLRGSCAAGLADDREGERALDFDVIWLDDHAADLELKYERVQLACSAPQHEGERLVWTTFRPRRGQRFYCPACQERYARQRSACDEAPQPAAEERADDGSPEERLRGTVKRKVVDRGFGFLQAPDGEDYFFHFTDLGADTTFDDLEEGSAVEFVVKRPPGPGTAGAAARVRRVAEGGGRQDPDESP